MPVQLPEYKGQTDLPSPNWPNPKYPNSATSRRLGVDWPQCSDVRWQGMMYMLNFTGRDLG